MVERVDRSGDKAVVIGIGHRFEAVEGSVIGGRRSAGVTLFQCGCQF